MRRLFPRMPRPERILQRITSLTDLAGFRDADPYMLESTLHGQARFGWVQHMWNAGMLATDLEWAEKARGAPLARIDARDGGHTRLQGVVHWPHEGHRLIVGTPGSGKFTAAIAPMLLEDDGCNAVVIDPKGGEGLRWTALYRDTIGRKAGSDPSARVMDPCGMYGGLESECLNPLDVIDLTRRNYVSEIDKLVDALIVTTGQEREPIWLQSAKKALRGVTLHLLTRGGSRRPSLLDVQHVLSEGLPDNFLEAMAGNTAADGLVQRCAMEISDLKVAENTWRGVKFQIDANLGFLDHLGVRQSLSRTSFDVRDLRRKRVSLYVVLPNKDKESLGRWLRLMYATIVDRIAETPGRGVHVVVDEFAALGRFDRVLTDLATLRASQIRFHVAVQDLNQLHELYGHGWQTIVGNCAVRQVLGVNENFTADYVSRSLGPTTVKDGYDYQQRHADAPPVRKPRFVGRDLMTPAEVLGMNPRKMILFADRCARPLLLGKSHYFAQSPWRERARDMRAYLASRR